MTMNRWPVGRGDRSEPTLWRGTLSLERPPAILVTPANLEGELRVILLAREGALPIPHAIGHDGGAVLHVPEAHRVSKLVGKEVLESSAGPRSICFPSLAG